MTNSLIAAEYLSYAYSPDAIEYLATIIIEVFSFIKIDVFKLIKLLLIHHPGNAAQNAFVEDSPLRSLPGWSNVSSSNSSSRDTKWIVC